MQQRCRLGRSWIKPGLSWTPETAKCCNPPVLHRRVAMLSRFPGVFYHGWRWRVFQRIWSSRDSCLLIEQSEYYTEIAAGFLCKRTEPCSGTFLGYYEVKDARHFFLFSFWHAFFCRDYHPITSFGCFLKWWYPQTIILIGFSIINHPFWGTPVFGNTHL